MTMQGAGAKRDGGLRPEGRVFRNAAAAALAETARSGAKTYERARALPKLIALAPWEIAEDGPEAGRRIVARLTRALRAERRRGIAGHWAYDLNRHIAIVQALAGEALLARGADDRSDKNAAR